MFSLRFDEGTGWLSKACMFSDARNYQEPQFTADSNMEHGFENLPCRVEFGFSAWNAKEPGWHEEMYYPLSTS